MTSPSSSQEVLDVIIGALRKDITDLNRIIRDGNGTPPIIARVILVEKEVGLSGSRISLVEQDLEKIKNMISKANYTRISDKGKNDLQTQSLRKDLDAIESSIKEAVGREVVELRHRERKKIVFLQFALSSIIAVVAALLGHYMDRPEVTISPQTLTQLKLTPDQLKLLKENIERDLEKGN